MSKDFSHGLQYFHDTEISGIGFRNAAILMGIGIDFYIHTIVNEKSGLLPASGHTTHLDASPLSPTEEAVRT